MKISIIGTGYVGLVSGVCLAEKGHHVVCVDNVREKVDNIQMGIPPIHEEGLEELLKRHVGNRLHVSTDLRAAVLDSEITLIAVGTPFDGTRIDLAYIEAVTREIGGVLADKNAYHVVVVKSTVVPGTTDHVVLPLLEETSGKRAGTDFGVGMNPEFLTEGRAIVDFMNPDRIVVGGSDEKAQSVLARVYEMFSGVELIRTNNSTAEMIKYASNSLLATMISFSNELAGLCTALGDIDATDVMKGVHKSQYLSKVLPDGSYEAAPITSFLEAGCGFGGSCLPKDVKALISHGERNGAPMNLLRAVIDINMRQPQRLVDKLIAHIPDLNGVTVGILGLAFKPDTDDVRESPAFPIMKILLDAGAQVTAYDPVARSTAQAAFPDDRVSYADSAEAVLKDAAAVFLVTRWNEFNRVPDLLESMDKPPILIDGRRMFDKNKIKRYEGVGL